MALTTSLNRFIRERFNFSLTLVVVACVLVFSACSGSGSTGLKTVSTIPITQETGVDEYTPATTPDKSEIPTIKPESSRMPDTSAAPKPDPTSIPTSQIVVTQEPELTPSPDVSSGPTSEPSVSLTPTVEVAPTSLPVPQPTNTELSLGFSADQTAEDFTLTDLNGTEVSLFQLLDEKPVMLQFGSYTWPPFRRQVAGTESLKNKYSDQVHFVIIYVVEAHPAGSISPYSNREWTAENSKDSQGNPIEQPADFVQRVDLADLCAAEDNITSTILIDDMQNSVWDTYGPAPNLAYFIGSDRKVIEAQHWYEMEKMDKVISSYLQASG